MKTTAKTILMTLLTSALVLGTSFARGPGGRPPHGPPSGGIPGGGEEKPPLPPLINALDQDLDGAISTDELKQASDALKKLDADNDGKLSGDELKPERPAGAAGQDDEKDRPRRKKHVPPVMKALDTNGDGEISEEEIKNATESLLQLDHNKDGKLSRMEIRPSRRFKPRANRD